MSEEDEPLPIGSDLETEIKKSESNKSESYVDIFSNIVCVILFIFLVSLFIGAVYVLL